MPRLVHAALALRSGSSLMRFRKGAEGRTHLAATSFERRRIRGIFQVSSCLYRDVCAARCERGAASADHESGA